MLQRMPSPNIPSDTALATCGHARGVKTPLVVPAIPSMRGLYAIVDADFVVRRGVSLQAFAEHVIAARPAVVQLRAKRAHSRDILAWLRAMRAPSQARGVLLFANDRPDLAVLAECDGVHVGQDDLDVRDVRRFAPRLLVGISTHDEQELDRALELSPDYVAYGPVFETVSKERPNAVVGLSGLERAHLRCRENRTPLVAIGGIDIERARRVAPLADFGAVISGLWPHGGDVARVTEHAAALHSALSGTDPFDSDRS